MLSIIIPTLNEENFLPLLLKSIKKQNFKDYEIIVADNNSTDKTIEIAKSYGCKVVRGGLPAKGRNEGAKVAQGDLFLFLDADAILPENSLDKFLKELEKKKLCVATCLIKSQNKNLISKIYFNIIYNIAILLLEKIRPSAMNFMLIKKDLHEKINGFDGEIKFGEDIDYLTRASRAGKFAILKSAKILASTRRFEKEGWLKVGFKYIFAHFLFLFGPIKSDILKYRFGHYSPPHHNEDYASHK